MGVNTLYQHCCISNEPLNFNPYNSFEKTQDLKPVQRYVYSCMGWKRATYIKYRSEGFKGLFPGKMALVEVSVLAGMLIKYEEDFVLCSKIEQAMELVPKVKERSVKNFTNYKQNDISSNLHRINL